MAVAVAMFAFSCVNDTTEDIAVKVGGKTTLAISLGGGNRTTLGEAENGVYPITWAEGDQITVNGETSEPLAAADADTANAVFTFNTENLSAPYCVAYPAAEANQVVFAAEQEYAEGTFASGAATMYGYATNGNITLNHLTGVLKIGIVCGEDVDIFDAPVIQSVKISTIDRAPIAGTFNIDFATGVVTPTADAVSVINYSIDEKLSQDPTYLHIAVPAGVYNELYVTLEDNNGGVMYATVTANDKKPLAAGNVREFSSDIVYKATTTTDKHIIKDYSSLLAFKEAVEGGSQLDAVFAGDVDLQGVNWGSINGEDYKGTIYGNGFAIKNLNAPLFNVTAASFKGLHLNVNMTITSTLASGSFAKQLKAIVEETPVLFENCTLSGTLTIDNQDFICNNNYIDTNNFGCFAGKAGGVTFSNCTNNATLIIKQLTHKDEDSVTFINIGGFVGYTVAAKDMFVHFSNCVNNCDIIWGEKDVKDGATIPHEVYAAGYIGGFVGRYAGAKAVGKFTDCCNNGDFYLHKGTRGVNLGGFVGYISGSSNEPKALTFKGKNINKGDISLLGKHTNNSVYISGVLAYANYSTMEFYGDEVINNGNITVNATLETTCYLAGALAYTTNYGFEPIKIGYNCKVTNNGNITIKSGSTFTGNLAFGGIGGYLWSTKTHPAAVSDEGMFINHGKMSMESGVAITGAGDSGTLLVGGMFGYSNGGLGGTGLHWVNTGDIELCGKFDPNKNTQIGGIVGRIGTGSANVRTINRAQCYCNITAYYVENGVEKSYPSVGMLTGREASGFGSCGNDYVGGTITTSSNNTVTLTADNYKNYVAGGGTSDSHTDAVNLLSSLSEIVYDFSR